MVDALSAIGANHIIHSLFEECCNLHLIAFVGNGKRIHPLQLNTGAHTSLATHAFAIVLHNGRRKHIDGILAQRRQPDKILCHDLVFGSQSL